MEIEKTKIEQLFSDGKVADIEKKAKELENIIKKIEEKEERWFELSAKIEGIENSGQCSSRKLSGAVFCFETIFHCDYGSHRITRATTLFIYNPNTFTRNAKNVGVAFYTRNLFVFYKKISIYLINNNAKQTFANLPDYK